VVRGAAPGSLFLARQEQWQKGTDFATLLLCNCNFKLYYNDYN
jgi:hypothetical protein